MRRISFGTFLLTLCLLLHAVPLSAQFTLVENGGQWPAKVDAAARFGNGHIFFEKDGLTFMLFHPDDVKGLHAHQYAGSHSMGPDSVRTHVFEMRFTGSSAKLQIREERPLSTFYHFILGNDAQKWSGRLRAWSEIRYQSLYDQIDFHYFESGGHLKYDIIVHPGGEVGDIRLQYRHLDTLYIDDIGRLRLVNRANELIEMIPKAFQISARGDTLLLNCSYRLKDGEISFSLPGGYDRKLPLIIDPVLAFSSYSGSYSDNFGFTATYDTSGFLYSGSIAFGNRYPTSSGAFMTDFAGMADIAISKFSKDGSQLIYSTYIGGSGTETPNSLVIGPKKELYIFGITGSVDFPVLANAFDPSFNGGTAVNYKSNGTNFAYGSDIYVCRLSANGDSLLASTFIGGSRNDGINAARRFAPSYPDTSLNLNYGDIFRGEIVVDHAGNAYVASCSNSEDFPVSSNAFQSSSGKRLDAVIFKFNRDMDTLIWSSYLGGSDMDAAFSIKLSDDESRLFVTGATASHDFPTTSGSLFPQFQGGVNDGILAMIDNKSFQLLRSTYFGGSGLDISYFVDFDFDGDIYITGNSDSPELTRIGNPAAYSNSGQFIARLDSNMTQIKMLTRFGSGRRFPELSPTAFLVDDCKNIYVSGWGGETNAYSRSKHPITNIRDMPLSPDAFQSHTDGSDFSFIVFSENADSLIYASYFGGAISDEHVDGGTSRFDKNGIIYQAVCAGCLGNSDFPTTTGAWSRENNSSNCNLGVIKFEFQLIEVHALATAGPELSGCAPLTVQFENLGKPGAYYIWDFGTGDSSNAENPVYTYRDSGNYKVRFYIKPGRTCRYIDSSLIEVEVLNTTEALFDIDPGKPELEKLVRFTNKSIGGEQYSWLLDRQAVSTEKNWSYRFGALGRYEICLAIKNEFCEDTLCRDIVFPLVDVPNAFTPNGDGNNDTLFVRGFGVIELDFRLYNRWGQLVFETDRLSQGWDGRFNGEEQDMDVYVYVLNALLENNEKVSKKGNITLIR